MNCLVRTGLKNTKGVVLSLLSVCALFGTSANALRLGTETASPYEQFLQANPAEQSKIVEGLKTWAASSGFSEDQMAALDSLLGINTEVAGDDVLELLGPKFTNWFLGVSPDEDFTLDALKEDVAWLSKTPQAASCMAYNVCVIINLGSQQMEAYLNGSPISGVHGQPISSGRGYTPRGTFSVEELAGKNRCSNKYSKRGKCAYMGYAMQIHGPYFLHATSKSNYHLLGRRASKGCVRMKLAPAAKLNGLMYANGRQNVRVVIR